MSDRIVNTNTYNEFGQVNAENFVQGDFIRIDGNSINLDMSHDLTQASPQIEKSIEQLQAQGKTIALAKNQVASSIVSQAQNNPTRKEQLLKWGQSIGDATVSDVVKSVVKLAIRSMTGLPLP